MGHLHLFKTKSQHDAVYNGSEYEEPWVAYIEDDEMVTYNKPHDYSNNYLTFEAIEDGTFSFTRSGVNYSLDGGETWTELEANASTPTVSAGGRIMFKGVLDIIEGEGEPMGVGTFSSSNSFNAMGNPYSLLYGDGFKSVRDLTGKDGALSKLFSGSTGLTSVENLLLPATTLANNCYYEMFSGCTSLTAAPELPATTLADYCYFSMFYGCTSLTTAPALPATTLAPECYFKMFKNCTSLTAAPELPATTLANNCYYEMFRNCTSLNYIKAMFTTTPSNTYTGYWLRGVASTGTFVKNSAASWTTTGGSGIPTGWTVETASA